MAAGRLIAPTPTVVGRKAGAERIDRLWLAALALAPLSGFLAAIVMPRGPVTTAQALSLIASAVAVGAVSGYLLRTRWALLLVPVAHLLAFELGRWGATGPTVDLPRLDSAYGVLALLPWAFLLPWLPAVLSDPVRLAGGAGGTVAVTSLPPAAPAESSTRPTDFRSGNFKSKF